jgi:hypothetical protein
MPLTVGLADNRSKVNDTATIDYVSPPSDSSDSVRPIHYSTPVTKLTHLNVYDRRDAVSERSASPSPPSSLTHVHRCIGSHNTTRETLSTSVKLTYLSVYDRRDAVSERIEGKTKIHVSWGKCLRTGFLMPVEGRRDRWAG